ncbi:MAG: tetratricopeptide repeat protein [Candidatus Hydrogenedentota bacterium]|nr:MAG: tetratricopeptide repeat protein [Candidatus Hydrogenedentota bacterium]
MLYFRRDPCAPCDVMEKWTFTDDGVLQALRGFIPVRIKGDVELQIVRRFGVRTFPMIVFASKEEGEIDRKAGYRDADSLLQWIEEVKANRTTLAALSKELARGSEDLDVLLKQSRNFMDADEMERALELAQKAADMAPGDANVLALYGLYYLRRNELEKAEAAVGAALQADAENHEARRLKIAILLSKADKLLADSRPADAIKLFSEVSEIEPHNFDACMGLARAHTATGETDTAFAELRRAVSLRPNSPVPHAALGELYQLNGNDAMAEKEYLKAVEIELRYEPPYFRLMELYEEGGRRDELMKTYKKVLSIEPAGAHNEIAWILATSKHPEIFAPEEAIRHANTAIELEPHPWYIDTLAEAYYAKGEYDLAIAIIKEAMAKKPDDMQYYQKQLEKFQKAREQAQSVRGTTDE